jgi:hypothetical protein
LLAAAALIVGLRLTTAEPMMPSLTEDLDGDGIEETVVAAPGRGGVRLEVRGGPGRKKAEATAPAPAADVVRVSLTTARIGSTGSLLEVAASTDASECISVWRYRDAALTRIPIRNAEGRALADCEAPGAWSHRWEREAEDAPSAWIRERTEPVERGSLRRIEVFTFAGFSLDADPKRSAAEIDGVPIPAWHESRLYTLPGLDTLYQRFDLAKFRSLPQLRIVTDRDRGVFALRFQTPGGQIVAPVEAFSFIPSESTAAVSARAGGKAVHATVRLGGDGSVPLEVQVNGLGREFDFPYAPAASWDGRVRRVFPSAAEEIASQYLTGAWAGREGGPVQIQIEGPPTYRVRIGKALFTLDLDDAPPATDFALRPAEEPGRVWGVVLRGQNALERMPMVCGAGDGAGKACRPDGPTETLRRVGARINVN